MIVAPERRAADNREVLEYDGTSGAVDNWYAYGLGSNAVLNQINSGARDTLVPDIQGSIIATLDSSSGVLTKYRYQTYGERDLPVVSGGTFRYLAERIDPETTGSAAEPSGLYYDRARR